MTETTPATQPIVRAALPNKARNRDAVPWRFITGVELTQDQVQAMAAVLLDGTKHHSLIQAYGGFGTTVFEGDYWATKGHGKDLSQVAKRWELVQERFPEYVQDATIEYRVPSALHDEHITPISPELEAALQAEVPVVAPSPIEE